MMAKDNTIYTKAINNGCTINRQSVIKKDSMRLIMDKERRSPKIGEEELDVVADTEISNQFVVAFAVCTFQITHQTAALTDKFQKTET